MKPGGKAAIGTRISLGNITGALLIIAGFIFLYTSINQRLKGNNFFYELNTFRFSGISVTDNSPYEGKALWNEFMKVKGVFLWDHAIPAGLFLLSLLLLWAGLSASTGVEPAKIFPARWKQLENRYFPWIVVAISFAILSMAHFYILHGLPFVHDEYSYVFQGDLLAHGKLYAQSPPFPHFFDFGGIVNDGRWYSRYTIGWPLLLAMGKLVGLEPFVNAICGALSVFFIFALSRKMFGEESGKLSVLFLAISPYFILMGATYYPHTASGLFAVMYAYFLLRVEDDSKLSSAVFAGLSLAFALLVRPLDGAVLFLGSIPLLFVVLKSMPHKALRPLSLILVLVGGGLGAAILLLQNWIQCGNPLAFGFSTYNKWESFGFGVVGHTPLMGAWNVAFAYMRNAFWTAPLLGMFAVASLFKKDKRIIPFFIMGLAQSLIYIGHYSLGILEFGSRYHLPAFLFILALASGGAIQFRETISSRWKAVNIRIFSPLLVLMTLAFMFFGSYPLIFPYYQQVYANFKAPLDFFLNNGSVQRPAIVFIREIRLNFPRGALEVPRYCRNKFNYEKQAVWLVPYLAPEDDKELVKAYPERHPYVAIFNTAQNHIEMTPFDVNFKPTRKDYLDACSNYSPSFVDRQEKAVVKAFGPLGALYNVGMYHYNWKEYDKAKDCFEKYIKIRPREAPAYFYLGVCRARTGDYEGAIRDLDTFLRRAPEDSNTKDAEEWIKFCRENKEK